jgi:uncharacterized protein
MICGMHADLPEFAAWEHRDARKGFEVVFLTATAAGIRLAGHTAAVESGSAWAVEYEIDLDPAWNTRTARIQGHAASGRRELNLEADGDGRWRIDGRPAPELDGCRDVDLESSVVTNALPVHRLGLSVGESAEAAAAYVRAADLSVERLEQRYVRVGDQGERGRYEYTAPQFEFRAELTYDKHGLVLNYPGIALRVV